MEEFNLYKDISARTKGEIFLGVVGPVRTGKSTFVRRFMEQLVLPQMEENDRTVARDELPVSGKGKTITTVEPKFVPKEAAAITLAEGLEAKIRLVDCVGFVTPGGGGPWREQSDPNGENSLVLRGAAFCHRRPDRHGKGDSRSLHGRRPHYLRRHIWRAPQTGF